MFIPGDLNSLLLAPTKPSDTLSASSSPHRHKGRHHKGMSKNDIHLPSSAKSQCTAGVHSPPTALVAPLQSPPTALVAVDSLDIRSCSRSFSPVPSDTDDDATLVKVPSSKQLSERCAGTRSRASITNLAEGPYQMKLPSFAHNWLLPISALCDDAALSIDSNKGVATLKRSGSSQNLSDRSHKSPHSPSHSKSMLPSPHAASPNGRSHMSESLNSLHTGRTESNSTSHRELMHPSLVLELPRPSTADVQQQQDHETTTPRPFRLIHRGRVVVTAVRQVKFDNVADRVVLPPPKPKKQRPIVMDE